MLQFPTAFLGRIGRRIAPQRSDILGQLPGDGAAVRDVEVLLRAFGAHHKAFVAALCFLKLWAQRLGVYGNVFGYPNGLALKVAGLTAGLDSQNKRKQKK